MTKTITIFFSIESIKEYPLSDPTYYDSYALLAQIAEKRHLDLRFVLGDSNYQDGLFKSYWKIKNGTLVSFEGSYNPGIVYIKSRTNLFDTIERVNAPILEDICRDKMLTQSTYPEFVKKTILLKSTKDVDELQTDPVVIKPRFGGSGKNVYIKNKHEMESFPFDEEEYIAQEIIEGSQGIPGLVAQRHELRLFVFNGEIKVAYLRLPKEGSFLANISQGASVQLMELSDIPEAAIELKNRVDSEFKNIRRRVYTLDVIFENGKPWIVELNDQPGVPDVSVQPLTTDYHNALLDVLSEE